MKDVWKALLAAVVCPIATVLFLIILVTTGWWDVLGNGVSAAMVALPLWLVKVGVIGIFVGLAVWAFTLPKEYIFKDVEDPAWWKDVRYWAAIVIGLVIIPYLVF